MAITLKVIESDFKLGVWKILEPESFFLDRYPFSQQMLSDIDQKHESHRLQLLASRAVLYDLNVSEHDFKIVKDDHGKPHVVNLQGDISFTHSHDYAAAIYSKTKLVGIDIQIATDKINRIARKFVSEDEYAYIREQDNALDYYHILWGAKESLYKSYGRRKVEFRENLFVHPFVYSDKGARISGRIVMPDYEGEFDIYYQKINTYYLVYCIEKTHA